MKTSSKRKSLRGQHSPQPLHFEQLEPRQLLAADFQITEFLASNRTGLVNDNGNTSDWIEIYNAGTSTGSLAGYTLTDDATVSNLFTFPAVDVAAGRYLVVYADNDAAPGTGSDLYTGFKLSAGGEYLGLYDPSANVVSEFGPGGTDYPDQQTDASYGLAFGGGSITVPFQTGYFLAPTPGEPNGIQVTGFAAEVSSSTAAGFYDAPFQVTLVSDTPGATIRYTTDGSTPSATNGAIYTGPLSITGTTNLRAIANRPGYVLTQPDTWTYIFVDDVVEQSNDGSTPAGWPSNWAQGQSIGNQAQTTDYGIDPDVRNRTDSNGGDQNIKDALLAIPSWSITTDLDNLFGTTGIYTNALGDGREWERPA